MAQGESQVSIRRQLDAKKEQIKLRLDALEGEIISTPAAIKSAVMKNPLFGIGAAVVAGGVVGLLLSARKKKRSSVAPAHEALIDSYIAAVAHEVGKGVRRGRDPEAVVRKSLLGRTPVIVYAPPDRESAAADSKGILRQVGDLTLKTALGFAVKTAIDLLIASVDVTKLQKALLLEEVESASGAETHQAHAGDGSPNAPTVQTGPHDR